MKVQGISTTSNLITNHSLLNVKNDKQEAWNQVEVEENPVKVNISEEGFNSLRKSIVEADGYSPQTYDDMVKLNDIMSKSVMDLSGTYFSEMLLAGKGSLSQKDNSSINNQAYNSFDFYANMYDEIVKGHEDGTREIWVCDDKSELGYRKLTKEEDLAALDQAYDKRAHQVDALAIQEQKYGKILDEHQKQVAEIRGEKSNNTKIMQEEPIDRLYERMMDSKNAFKNRYSVNTTQGDGHQNIASLINEIFTAQFTR